MSPDVLAVIEGIATAGGDVDDVLGATVSRLADEPDVSWAGIRFVEGDALALGPSAGMHDDDRAVSTPIEYRGAPVGELIVHGAADEGLLRQIAELVAPYVLLGWDTDGEAWTP